HGHRLIGAFAAGKHGEVAPEDGLAGSRDMRHARKRVHFDAAADDDVPLVGHSAKRALRSVPLLSATIVGPTVSRETFDCGGCDAAFAFSCASHSRPSLEVDDRLTLAVGRLYGAGAAALLKGDLR